MKKQVRKKEKVSVGTKKKVLSQDQMAMITGGEIKSAVIWC